MKLNELQINAFANKILRKIKSETVKKANNKENIKIIEDFKSELKKIIEEKKILDNKLYKIKTDLSKTLNISQNFILGNNDSNEEILNKVNVDFDINFIKDEIILSSITEDISDLESFINNIVAKLQ